MILNSFKMNILALLLIICCQSLTMAVMPADYVDVSGYVTLNAAVTDARIENKNGIYIPAGYTVSAIGPVPSLPSGFGIMGENKLTSIVQFTGMGIAYNGFVSSETAPSDICFKNFTINTSSIAPPSGTEGNQYGVINLTSANNIVVQDVRFLESPRNAIRLRDSNNISITNCEFIDCAFVRISVTGTNYIISNNIMAGGTWYGIFAANGSCFQITDNQISELGGDNGVGLHMSSLSYSLIQNNTIGHTAAYGIFSASTSAGLTGTCYNAIANNTITGVGVVGGVSVNGAGSGIVLWPGANHNLIQGNNVASCLGYGILVAGQDVDSPWNIVSGNSVTGSDDPGIVVSGASDALVRKNVSSNNSSCGFLIGNELDNITGIDVNSPRAKVINNRAENNSLEGFHIDSVLDGVITGNLAQDNGVGSAVEHTSSGIMLFSDPCVSGNMVQCNTLKDTGSGYQDYGIYIDTGVNNNIVRYNDLYSNVVASLQDSSGASNSISNNRTASSATVLDTAPPVADAGLGSVLDTSTSSATLDGSGSYLISGTGSLTYHWEQVFGSTVNVTNPNAAVTEFRRSTMVTFELLGFRLTVSNANGSTYDEVYFAVQPFAPIYLPSDVNNDFYVDINDLSAITLKWLECTDPEVSYCDQFWK